MNKFSKALKCECISQVVGALSMLEEQVDSADKLFHSFYTEALGLNKKEKEALAAELDRAMAAVWMVRNTLMKKKGDIQNAALAARSRRR